MLEKNQFDYLGLTENIIIELFEKKNIDDVTQYFAEDMRILGAHSKQAFQNGLLTHQQSSNQYKIINTDLHVVVENESLSVIEGSIEINKNYNHPFIIELTIIYENRNNKTLITHFHFSHSNYSSQSLFNQDIRYASPLAGLCSYYCDDNLSLRSVNDTLASMLGYTKDEFMKTYHTSAIDLIYKKDQKLFKNAIKECLENGHNFHVEFRLVKKDGSLIWVMEQGETFIDFTGRPVINAFICDISSLKKSELDLVVQKQKYSLALKDNSITILEYDIEKDSVIIDIQEESKKKIYEHYLDYIASEHSTVFDEDKPKVIGLFTRKISGPIEIREHIRGTNQYLRKSIDSVIINDDKGNPAIVLATAKDITTEWNHKAILEQRAQRDALTHILNLEGGKEQIEDYLSYRPHKEPFAFMILDIDYFKTINDTHGHLFGNNVLIAFAQCLKSLIRDNDIIARIGGDEFIILLKNITKDQTISKAKSICQAVRDIQLEKDDTITTSIGVYVADEGQLLYTFQQMFENADLALYQAKKHGRNGFELYDQKKDVQNLNKQTFDDLYDQISKLIPPQDVSENDVQNIMKLIGEHYHFNRISHMHIDMDTKKFTHKNLWISSRAYQGNNTEGTINDKDFHQLCYHPMKIVDFSENTLDLSDELIEFIKHGVAKSITLVYMNKTNFFSFVDYQHHRELSHKDEEEMIELMDLLKIKNLPSH